MTAPTRPVPRTPAPGPLGSRPPQSPASRLLTSGETVPAGRVGAWYDLLATAGFATPWTAALLLDLLRGLHTALGLPGEPLPAFDAGQLLFVTLFGAGVTTWSLARVLRPVPLLVGLDTLARAAFSLLFLAALAAGASALLVPFLVVEVAFLLAQGLGVRAALRRTGDPEPTTPAAA
ncbi:hypothetical protein [Kineococcus sp. NUM-3379]